MVNSNYYSYKKGIYKDLYMAISQENEKKQNANSCENRQRKGIYSNLYAEIRKNKQVDKNKKDDENIWHTYPLKAFVYSNDIGESLKPLIGGLFAKLFWLPSLLYSIFAVMSQNKPKNKKNGVIKEILFQFFASLLLPYLFIKSISKLTNRFINYLSSGTKQKIKKCIKSCNYLDNFCNIFKNKHASGYRNIGLAATNTVALAFAVKPIDNIVANSLDRLYYEKKDK